MKNTSKFNLKLSAISIGVITLFAVNAAMADDEEIRALTQPKSSVQVEMIGVDQNSAKFGEYNGLYGHPSGAYPNGGFSVKGGSSYSNNEQGDTTRYSITGENLGLTSRSANASIADQGSWNIGINYDQLQHNITDTYQTPYQGGMNGTSFTLPAGLTGANQLYKAPATGAGASSVTNPTGTQAMNAAQLGSFGNMAISSSRFNTTVSGSVVVDPTFNLNFEYNHLLQSGAKLGAYSSAGSTTVTNFPNVASQSVAILPSPTNSTTDTVNLAANWRGDNSHLTASYFGSFYQNNVNSVNWQTFLATSSITLNTAIQTMSTAPSNSFNQLNLAGGYDFSTKTKLTGNASIGQNTQNQGFGGTYNSYLAPSLPQASMNGLVNTTHADVRLMDQSIKDLTLTALAKFDQRDNLSQSNMYGGYSITGDLANIPNTPLSTKQTQLGLSSDYRISKDQKVGLTLANNSVNRWCNQYGTPGGLTGAQLPQGGTSTSTTSSAFYNSTNCTSATSSNENKADLNYKIKATEDLDFKTSVGYSNRKTQWDQSVVTAFPYQTGASFPLPVVGSSVTAANQPAVGTNGANYPGFMPFFEASRKQFVGKAGSNWRVNDDLSLSLGGKYTNDTYPDSQFGVQNGYSWSLNFDSTYAYSETGTVVAYVTQQNMQRSLSNYYSAVSKSPDNAVTAAGGWSNNLQTNATTVGLGAKQGGLVNGKVGVMADLTYSMASSRYNTQNNYAPTTCAAAGTCGMLPAIQNNLAVLKLGGTYELDKNSKLGFMYWFQHLYSNDYYYNGYQYGATPSAVLPTNQTAPSYSVNVFAVNYTYSFD